MEIQDPLQEPQPESQSPGIRREYCQEEQVPHNPEGDALNLGMDELIQIITDIKNELLRRMARVERSNAQITNILEGCFNERHNNNEPEWLNEPGDEMQEEVREEVG